LDAYRRCREWLDSAIELVRPGATTDQIAAVWPEADEIGLPDERAAFGLQFGHGLGVGLYESPMISRLHSLDSPVELEIGMVFALETYCPATDGRSAARIEEEVVAVGVASTLRAGDRVAGTYRGHGHALALGLEPQKLMDELLGRATGVCGGRAGSMNVVDLEHGLIGCFGIVGGSIAAATGAALAFRGSGNVAVAFFGDGAINQAYF